MNQINILWSFSSIETSISEIFAIKNCYFFGPYLRRVVGKIVGKNSLWRQCWSGKKKAGNSKQIFSSRLDAEVVFTAINLERTGNLSSKVASCGYNLLITEEYIIVKRTLTTFTNSLELYWKCGCVSPMFFKMHSQNVFI